jgi:hypothetical protein
MTQDEPPCVVFVWAVKFGMSISKEFLVCWYSTECVFAAKIGHLIILNTHVSFRHTIYFKSLKIFKKQITNSHVITGTYGYADLERFRGSEGAGPRVKNLNYRNNKKFLEISQNNY